MDSLCENERIVGMPLCSQTERLETLQQQERAEWVEGRSEVAKDLHSDLDGKRNRTEGLAELQAMVSFRWLGEVGELSRCGPVELA